MKITRTGSSHYLSKDTATLPKGTIMFHYAVEGTKEELEAFETAKGANFSTFEEGKYKDKPFHCSSKILCNADESVNVELRNGIINVVESDEDRVAKSQERIESIKAEKALEKKAQLAQKYGLTVTF